MLKLSIAAGSLGLMALALPMQAHAQYGYGYNDPGIRNVQCERQKSDNSAAGTVVGALAGALIGGQGGHNIENDPTYMEYTRRGSPTGRPPQGHSQPAPCAAAALTCPEACVVTVVRTASILGAMLSGGGGGAWR